ncbi:MAG: hypothetical protein MI975_22525 [Cytophagales bacterium]|nr:hypothetical protein [Cytophagales bacterium]
MESVFARYHALLITFLFCTILSSCVHTDHEIARPVISVTPFNTSNLNESIAGQIHGADVQLYNIAVYAKVRSGWYTLPNRDSPIISISNDKRWVCELSGVKKEDITKVSIFLVPNGYEPPILQGQNIIPIKMNLMSASKKIIVL